jgi:GntR family transcriptional regulator
MEVYKNRLQISVKPASGIPLYRQIIRQIEEAIASGNMQKGTQLPTIRSLAANLRINPNTVKRAYNELEIRGLVNTIQGTGSYISGKKTDLSDRERGEMLLKRLRKAVFFQFSF